MGSQIISQAPRIAKALPLIAGGITGASTMKPEDLEYLKDGFLSLINPSNNSLNPLKEILKSKNEMITVEEPFDIKKEVATKKDFNPEDFEKINQILKGSGFTESGDMDRLPGFTEVKEEKVNIGDVGFTEAEQMPTILTAGIAPENINPEDITDKSYEKVQVRVNGPILEQFDDPGKGVYIVKNPDGSYTNLKGKVFENVNLKVDPDAFDIRTCNAKNEIVGGYNLRDDIITTENGSRKYVGEGDIYKVNRLTGRNFDITQVPEGTNIDKTSAKNGVIAVTKGLSTGGQHYYTMGIDFQNPTQLMEYPENKDNPRLLPTSTGKLNLGNIVGEIKIKSSKKAHPIYDSIVIGNQ